MTRYEAFIEKSWRTSGITQLIVARIRADGRADIGFFLVDLWCLGVKDAFLDEDGSEDFLRELLTERLPEEFRERFHPACAKKMIDGALAYAEQFGIAPHRDYRKARRALSGLDATACPETFTFGRDGKPCYVEGPHDTPERTERILALLEARCGSNGFDYELFQDDDEADVDDARGALQMFFADLDENAPNFYQFAGLVAALHTCPTPVPPTQLLARLFGPDGHTWTDADEAKDFADDVGVYWNYIADLIAVSATEPTGEVRPDPIDIFEDDFDEPDAEMKRRLMATAFFDWAYGFLRATQEWPDAWGNALTRPDLAEHWATLRAWAEPTSPASITHLTGDGTSSIPAPGSRSLPAAAIALIRAMRPTAPPV